MRKIKILLIDDLESTLDGVRKYLESRDYEVVTHLIRVGTDAEAELIKKIVEGSITENCDELIKKIIETSIEKNRAELIKKINGGDFDVVMADRGFYAQDIFSVEDLTKHNIDHPEEFNPENYGAINEKGIFEAVVLIKDIKFDVDDLFCPKNGSSIFEEIDVEKKNKLRMVIIRTYNRNLFYNKIHEIEKSIDALFDRKITFVCENAFYFSKPYPKDRLYWGYDEKAKYYYLNEKSRQDYEESWASDLDKIIQQDISGKENNVFSEGYEISETLRVMNAVRTDDIHKEQKLREDTQYKINQLTFISNILDNEAQPSTVIDVPYKNYYPELIQEMEDQKLYDNIFKDEKKNYLKDSYCFYDFNVTPKGETYTIDLYYFKTNVKDKTKEKGLKDFLKYLYPSVFYEKRYAVSELIPDAQKPSESTESIKILFSFGELNSKEFGETAQNAQSLLNYSFWKIDKKTYTEKDIEKDYHALFATYYLQLKGLMESPLIVPLRKKSINNFELANYKNHIRQFSHVITNLNNFLSVTSRIKDVCAKKIEDEELRIYICEKIESIERNSNVIKLMNYAVTEDIEAVQKILHDFNVHKMIDYIQKHLPTKKVIVNILNGYVKKLDINMPKERLLNYFLLFFNIYSNAIKGQPKGTKLDINIKSKNDLLSIEFENSGGKPMPDEYLTYINNYLAEPNIENLIAYPKRDNYKPYGGLITILEIVGFKCKEELKLEVTKEPSNNKVTFQITVNTHKYENIRKNNSK